MRNYIRWTTSENSKVASAVVDAVGVSYDVSNPVGILGHVRKAQNALEPCRRRDIKTRHQIKDLMPYIENEIRFRKSGAQTREAEKAAQSAAEQTQKHSTAQIEALVLALLDSPVADKLLDKLADKLAARMCSAPVEPSEEIPVCRHDPNPVQDQRPRKLTIGVIGLLPEQARILQSTFDDVDFKFYERRLPKQLPTVDYMVGMVGFMRHSTDGSAITAYPGRYVRISHGTTQLHNKVRELQTRGIPRD